MGFIFSKAFEQTYLYFQPTEQLALNKGKFHVTFLTHPLHAEGWRWGFGKNHLLITDISTKKSTVH